MILAKSNLGLLSVESLASMATLSWNDDSLLVHLSPHHCHLLSFWNISLVMLHLWLVMGDVVLAGLDLMPSGDKLLHFFIDGFLIINILLVSSRMSRCHGNTFHYCFWRFLAGQPTWQRSPQCMYWYSTNSSVLEEYWLNVFSSFLGIIASTIIILERERERNKGSVSHDKSDK